uniref:Uncharacterized protein n=1 Tax=Peronospora matthiolae TaxID=2874970 RepID=A0AAV1V360_9STRA
MKHWYIRCTLMCQWVRGKPAMFLVTMCHTNFVEIT